MPTYEYACDSCNHQFEEYQSITAKLKRKCPKCGKSTLRRLIGTGGGVIFKGSGFYETDYKRAAPAKKPESTKTPETKPKTETKSTTPKKD